MLRWVGSFFVACLVAGFTASVVQAADVNAIGFQLIDTPPTGFYGPGDTIKLGVTFQFDTTTLGGGIELRFDESIFEAITGFKLSDRFPFDPLKPNNSFNRPLGFFSPEHPLLFAIVDANLIFGEGLAATFDLPIKQVLPPGVTGIDTREIGDGSVRSRGNESPAGPFIDENGNPIDVAFLAAPLRAVPEAGTLLLVGAGLAGLASARHRPFLSPSGNA